MALKSAKEAFETSMRNKIVTKEKAESFVQDIIDCATEQEKLFALIEYADIKPHFTYIVSELKKAGYDVTAERDGLKVYWGPTTLEKVETKPQNEYACDCDFCNDCDNEDPVDVEDDFSEDL